MLLLAADGRIRDSNPTAAQMLGHDDPSTVVGRHPVDFSPPEQPDGEDSWQKASRMLQTAVDEGSCRFEWLHQSSGGKAIHAAVVLTVLDDPEEPLLLAHWQDISERWRMEAEQRRKVAFQEMVTIISRDFLTTPLAQVDEAIDRTLARVGRFFGADRASVVQFIEADGVIDQTHEWCRDIIEPQAHRLTRFPIGAQPWITTRLRRGEAVHIPDIGQLPSEAAAEYQDFRAQGIRSMLALPMATGDRVLGGLGLEQVRTPQHWSDFEIGLMQVVAEIVAAALLRQHSERQRRELAALQAAVADISAQMTDPTRDGMDHIIDRALARTGSLFGADRSYIFHFDDAFATISNTHEWCADGVSSERASLQGLAVNDYAWTTDQILRGETIHVPDTTTLTDDSVERVEFEREGIQSILMLPLISDQRIYGFIGYDMVAARRTWSDDEIAALKLVAEIIAGTLARLRTEEELRRSEKKHRTLIEATSDAVHLHDENGLLIDFNQASLAMFRCTRDEFLNTDRADWSPPTQPCGTDSRTLAQEKLQKTLERGNHFFEWMSRRADGEIFPTEVQLTAINLEGQQVIQAIVRDITERKALEAELERQATHDRVIGIYNRAKLYTLLDDARARHERFGTPFSVIMLDIDRFKEINDTYGHSAGDAVLRELATHLQQALRETDYLGRWGGEEFLIIAGHTERTDAERLAERLRETVSRTTFSGAVAITISLGVAEFEQAEAREHLEKRVDEALYAAKQSGRNRVALA
jgi:diguanylate cyclase (GGDEF)-like protein/PAS domain S-box-containing protein